MFLKRYLINLVVKARMDNDAHIMNLLEKNKSARVLDLGCDDGQWLLGAGKKIGTQHLFGVDIVEKQIQKARDSGIKAVCADLNNTLPFADNFFDLIHSNQVIEHIHDLEKFIKEIYRVLKPKGYVIISTENLASWHNIFSLFLGWQPFSATNYLLKSLGNPWSLWRGSESDAGESWCHDKLWAYRGAKEFFEDYNFKIEKIKGAGYYPLPSFFGDLDKRHCHFMTFKIKKNG